MEIYLIRHSEPEIAKGICYGFADVDIKPIDEFFLSELKANIPNEVDKVFSSPLIRCHKLAQLLFQQPIILEDRLKEMNFGDWELKHWNEINQKQLDYWMNDFVNVKVPNGESLIDLSLRTVEFFNEIHNQNNKTTVIITHAGVIRSAIHYYEKIPLSKTFDIKIDYNSVWKFSKQ